MRDKSNIFLIIFIVFVLVAVYFWYTQFRNTSLETTAPLLGDSQLLGREFVLLVNKLRSVQIDNNFFSDERFTSLKDLTPTIEMPDKIGRDNPFAAIGG